MTRHWGGGIELVRPNIKIAKIVEGYIYRQLNNSLTEKDGDKFRQLTNNFIKDNRLDAVILGCTELPLVYGSSDDPSIIDTLQVLSDGLLLSYFNR